MRLNRTWRLVFTVYSYTYILYETPWIMPLQNRDILIHGRHILPYRAKFSDLIFWPSLTLQWGAVLWEFFLTSSWWIESILKRQESTSPTRHIFLTWCSMPHITLKCYPNCPSTFIQRRSTFVAKSAIRKSFMPFLTLAMYESPSTF
jgi:hypothetical protein